MWLLSRAHKNTQYPRNIFFPEAFLFMEEEVLTLHKTPCNLFSNNTTALEFQSPPNKIPLETNILLWCHATSILCWKNTSLK